MFVVDQARIGGYDCDALRRAATVSEKVSVSENRRAYAARGEMEMGESGASDDADLSKRDCVYRDWLS